MADDVSMNVSADPRDAPALTRRQAMFGVGVGAAVLVGTNLGTAYVVSQSTRQEVEQAAHVKIADAQTTLAQTQAQVQALQAEIAKLQGLLFLYESLEKIGVDAIIAGGLNVFHTILEGLRGGVNALRAGMDTTETALANVDGAFAAIRDGLKTAEDAVANIAALFQNTQKWLSQATSPVAPLAEQIGQFFSDLLGKIPFGVGDTIKHTIEGLTGLTVAVPSMITSVNAALLEPLRAGWFSEDNARNLQGTLLDPLRGHVFEPARQLLADVEEAIRKWEEQVQAPLQSALDERAVVHQQIDEYKKQHDLK